jgi:hypothetical protein
MNKLVSILEIMKRKLVDFNYIINLYWDGDKKSKYACMKIDIKSGKDFIEKNVDSLNGIIYIYFSIKN